VYRWGYGGSGLKTMRRMVLGRAGIRPVRTTLVGRTHALSAEQVAAWGDHMRRLGGSAV